jgi:adenylosuccinate synthase
MIADVIVDLQYGDCGKGKITHYLCSTGKYTHVVRYNGGCNAGHTIYHHGKKFVTHHIPAGVFFGVKSIIGPGCVVNPEQFFKEIEELEAGGLEVRSLVKIAKNTHIITRSHLSDDSGDTTIGTTKRGNGPAYSDKYARTGVRAESVPELQEFLVDFLEEMHQEGTIALFEGAQGFGLDIDWGDYPYVTSSHCTVAGAMLNGVPPKAIRNVWGVAKAYETYVGTKKFQGEDPIFDEICEIGEEYGATTGRKRQVNWMNWNLIDTAIKVNGVTHLVVNKMDVLREVDTWKALVDEKIHNFDSESDFLDFVLQNLAETGISVYFSGDKARI